MGGASVLCGRGGGPAASSPAQDLHAPRSGTPCLRTRRKESNPSVYGTASRSVKAPCVCGHILGGGGPPLLSRVAGQSPWGTATRAFSGELTTGTLRKRGQAPRGLPLRRLSLRFVFACLQCQWDRHRGQSLTQSLARSRGGSSCLAAPAPDALPTASADPASGQRGDGEPTETPR